jgi:hypothetical protein
MFLLLQQVSVVHCTHYARKQSKGLSWIVFSSNLIFTETVSESVFVSEFESESNSKQIELTSPDKDLFLTFVACC